MTEGRRSAFERSEQHAQLELAEVRADGLRLEIGEERRKLFFEGQGKTERDQRIASLYTPTGAQDETLSVALE